MDGATGRTSSRRIAAAAAVAALISFGLLVVAAVALTRDPSAQAVAGVAIGVCGLLVVLVPGIWRRWAGRAVPLDNRAELEIAAANLADVVQSRWRREAENRGVTQPATIRVSWSRNERSATGPRPPRGARPREIPLVSPAPRLLDAGIVEELHALYLHPDVDKVVLLGKAGAGKSGALVQLLLEALRYREQLDERHYDVPVPVMLTLGDWDPQSQELLEWADTALRRDYGVVFTSTGESVYRKLLDDGRIALFLDGLEEMPERLWDAAGALIQAQSSIRLVLTARPRAARHAQVAFAARVQLEPVGVGDAIDYLRSARSATVHPELWEELLHHMRERPNALVSRVLSTPLMLTLALNAYDRAGKDPRDLSRMETFSDERAIEEFLIGQIIPVAFCQPPYEEQQAASAVEAEQCLRELATRMGEGRDLAWWRIRRWLPWLIPALISGIFAAFLGLVAGWLGGVDVGLAMGAPSALVALVAAGGITFWATHKGLDEISGDRPRVLISLTIGVVFGICLAVLGNIESDVYAFDLRSVGLGLVFGLGAGVALGFLALHDGPLVAELRCVDRRDALFGVPAGAATGLAYGIAAGSAGIAAAVALVAAVGFTLGVAWTRPPDRPEQGATPFNSFRGDLRGSFVIGLTVGGTVAAALVIVFSQRHGLAFAVPTAAVVSLPFSTLTALTASQACGLLLVTWMLRLRGNHLPWLLISPRGRSADGIHSHRDLAGFLEQARSLQILRSVGALYQFRHARLQDQLRGITWAEEDE